MARRKGIEATAGSRLRSVIKDMRHYAEDPCGEDRDAILDWIAALERIAFCAACDGRGPSDGAKAKKAGKNMGKGLSKKQLEQALEVCDEAEDIAGEKGAPMAALTAARLMTGDEVSFKRLLDQSVKNVSWADVREEYAAAMADEGDEDEDDGEDYEADDDEVEEAVNAERSRRSRR